MEETNSFVYFYNNGLEGNIEDCEDISLELGLFFSLYFVFYFFMSLFIFNLISNLSVHSVFEMGRYALVHSTGSSIF